MNRVFALDVLICPRCGGSRRLIAVLTDPRVVRAMLVQPMATSKRMTWGRTGGSSVRTMPLWTGIHPVMW